MYKIGCRTLHGYHFWWDDILYASLDTAKEAMNKEDGKTRERLTLYKSVCMGKWEKVEE